MNQLLTLLKEPKIEQLFLEVSGGNHNARSQLVEKLNDAFLPKPPKISSITYNAHEQDLRHEFLLRILEGRLRWDPERGKLTTYISAILNNLWNDELKKKTPVCESVMDSDLSCVAKVESHSDCSPTLKPARHKELCALSRNKRVIIKMWRPYLFNYRFDLDEKYFLEKCNIDIEELQKRLREEMDEAIRHNKDYISPDVIAELLGNKKKRNTIDQILSRSKKQIPWLGDLKNELE